LMSEKLLHQARAANSFSKSKPKANRKQSMYSSHTRSVTLDVCDCGDRALMFPIEIFRHEIRSQIVAPCYPSLHKTQLLAFVRKMKLSHLFTLLLLGLVGVLASVRDAPPNEVVRQLGRSESQATHLSLRASTRHLCRDAQAAPEQEASALVTDVETQGQTRKLVRHHADQLDRALGKGKGGSSKSGKGKGKGSSKSGKGKGKGGSSKSGKGKGKGGSKSGKGKGKGGSKSGKGKGKGGSKSGKGKGKGGSKSGKGKGTLA
jgi:hypothetical protein